MEQPQINTGKEEEKKPLVGGGEEAGPPKRRFPPRFKMCARKRVFIPSPVRAPSLGETSSEEDKSLTLTA